MHRPFPTKDGFGDGTARVAPDIAAFTTLLSLIAARHDDLHGTPHADEVGREIRHPPRHAPEDPHGLRVVVMVPDVDDDAEPASTEGDDRTVEGVEEDRDVLLRGRAAPAPGRRPIPGRSRSGMT